jgi:hypothetical protein
MKYREFYNRVIGHLGQYKQKFMIDIENGTYRGHEKIHILPKDKRDKNLLPLSTGIKKKDYHMYAHHLNSSQMMCINFFSPLINEKNIFIEIICNQLNITKTPDMQIKTMIFEYTPDGFKHTNFDFYVELINGIKFYFEVKYTESEFGSTNKDIRHLDRYQREWDNFYKEQLSCSMHLKNISQAEFYSNYQINRNIAYVKSENDYVCFLYPFDNCNLHKEVELINYRNVFKINWDDLCSKALNVTKGTKYEAHYTAFKEKYLDYSRD